MFENLIYYIFCKTYFKQQQKSIWCPVNITWNKEVSAVGTMALGLGTKEDIYVFNNNNHVKFSFNKYKSFF